LSSKSAAIYKAGNVYKIILSQYKRIDKYSCIMYINQRKINVNIAGFISGRRFQHWSQP